jgi:hypothetical protein
VMKLLGFRGGDVTVAVCCIVNCNLRFRSESIGWCVSFPKRDQYLFLHIFAPGVCANLSVYRVPVKVGNWDSSHSLRNDCPTAVSYHFYIYFLSSFILCSFLLAPIFYLFTLFFIYLFLSPFLVTFSLHFINVFRNCYFCFFALLFLSQFNSLDSCIYFFSL